MFIAILDVSSSREGRFIKFLQTVDFKKSYASCLSEYDFVAELRKFSSLPKDSVRFINFGFDGTKIEESAGSFSRFADKNGVSPRVVLAEYVSEAGRTIGYLISDKNGNILRVKKDDLLNACDKSKSAGVPFLQNAIYRVTDGTAMIASYPGMEFFKVVQKLKKKMPEPKVAEHIEKPVPVKEDSKSSESKANKPTDKQKNSDRYSEAQKKELIAAKKNGVDPLIVSNPKLTPEQMRVIWTAKKNNRSSEYFANPKFSVEQMQFFADRLVDKKMFNECKGIINPKFSVEQLGELYMGICDGVDYTVYADPEMSAEDMYIKRNELSCKTYAKVLVGNVSKSDGDAFLKRLK